MGEGLRRIFAPHAALFAGLPRFDAATPTAANHHPPLTQKVRDIMTPPARDKFNDVYLVYELMDTDLHQIIRSSQPLTNEHFQYFVYQVCSSWGGCVAGAGGCVVCVTVFVCAARLFWDTHLHTTRPPPHHQHTNKRTGAARPQVRAHRQRAAPRPQALQPAAQRELRPQDLRLWARAHQVRVLVA